MDNVELLSRIQFAFTIAFHYIYPPLSIGLGVCLVVMEGLYLKTKDKVYEELTRFWVRIFALIFGIGVATGIVMEFEFGTNWAVYSRYVGDIFGSALAAEGIFAFALESAFLGVLLFGWNRVSPRVHFMATVLVALGSIFSALWIVVANSWQQTPSGYRIEGEGMQARAIVTNFWDMVLNPSSLERYSHVLIGALLSGSFLVLSVSAWYILKKNYTAHAQAAFRIALWVAGIAALGQLFTGHKSAEVVTKYQPAKLATMEGHFEKSAPADMYLFGWVNASEQKTTGLKIPGGLSFLVHQDFKAPIPGLNSFKPEDRPTAINFVFQTYHLMVAIGMTLIGLTWFGLFMLYRKKLFETRWLMQLFVWSVLLPQIANQVGWYTAEVGRQPWVVYGLLRTSDALSQAVKAEHVLASLILFTLVYVLLFGLFLYLLNKKIQHGLDVSNNGETSSRMNPSFLPMIE
ncbi:MULTISPECIES: cytochrome ubiquinol oxidase subunit I [unclassified Spirosoma]|uniref:cytochrome ubiquinol oxidase subunit I n=1 Tax=unclassified Spirosoma TaxID=2621999 RepID=UPI000961A014|nr:MULTISPECIES: cytochrome ubiquinol oxidase subunit I [unclassified Spirosoma]MBN8820576.1 cytochrome ubiquinol oxidase subunit I [Spirosoma sp.]OJW71089.1 MAG: cytochrome ubiquinol oxidase subunit I [Spirosoma sp. 48-14]